MKTQDIAQKNPTRRLKKIKRIGVGDPFEAIKKARKAGLTITSITDYHHRVELKVNYIDWWVNTGTWITKNGVRGYGVDDLIIQAKKD